MDIMELSPMLKEIKSLKRIVTRTRPHSAKLSNCERNERKT